MVLPSGLQHMLIFSPLVFTTDTHLLAVKGNYNKRVVMHSSGSKQFNMLAFQM